MKRFRQSFRFKILALTILVCGTVLAAFGLGSRYALYVIKISTVDQSLRTMPFREFPHPKHEQSWIRLAEATDRVAQRIFNGDVHILAYGADETVFFQTEYWPSDELVAALPVPEGELAPPKRPDRFVQSDWWYHSNRRRGGGPRGPETGEPPNPDRGPRGPPENAISVDTPRAIDSDGDRGRPGGRDPVIRPDDRGIRPSGPPILTTRMGPDGPIRFGVFPFSGYSVAVGVELSKVAREMTHARNAFLISAPFALLIVAIGAWVIASRAISPIRKLTVTASGMSAAKLDERISRGNEDREFSELIEVFNDMLERLERSFNQATRFSADAAHELKTPLTILQGHLESALQEAPDDSEQQRRLGMLLEETQRLHGITRRLLLLAQADAGQINVSAKPVKVGSLIAELIEDFEMQSAQTRFSVDVDSKTALSVDDSLVTQIVQNLLSNALKYNDDSDPWVSIELAVDESEMRLEISNGGDGIPIESQRRLFDRFSRVDSARNRSVDGFGLGLNLSREFARAHGGDLDLVESVEGKTCFRLTIPNQG